MTQSDAMPPVTVQDALRTRDLTRAQSLLDEVGDAFSKNKQDVLQARIHIASGQPEKAIGNLKASFGDTPTAPYVRTILAQAYMAIGDATNALNQLESTAGATVAEPASLLDARLRISAFTALCKRGKTVAAVNTALKAYPDTPALAQFSIKALVGVGALTDAARLIGTIQPGQILSYAVLDDFVGCCLRQHQVAILQQVLPHIANLTGRQVDFLIQRGWMRTQTPDERADSVATIVELADGIGSSKLTFQLTNLLYSQGFEHEADKMLARIRELAQGGEAAALRTTAPASAVVPKLRKQKLKLVMDWLDIPQDQREGWQAEVARTSQEVNDRKYLLAANPDYLNEFRRSLMPAQLSPLEAIARQEKPAILATVHAGVLMGTLVHLAWHKIPIVIMGGNPVLQRVLPGFERLNPIPKNETPVQTARKMIRLIRSGQIVALAAEGAQGTERHSFVHRGVVFDLPDSIPQIAYKYRIAVIWMVTYWREDRIICDCAEGPLPKEGETYASYRERWFAFLLDRLYDIGRASPKNAYFNYSIMRKSLK